MEKEGRLRVVKPIHSKYSYDNAENRTHKVAQIFPGHNSHVIHEGAKTQPIKSSSRFP